MPDRPEVLPSPSHGDIAQSRESLLFQRTGLTQVVNKLPSRGLRGEIVFHRTDKVLYAWDGTQWVYMPATGGKGTALQFLRMNSAGTNTEWVTLLHSLLGGVTADQHHAQTHTHGSHTGVGPNDHHAQVHTHDVTTAPGAVAAVRVFNSVNISVINNSSQVLTFNSEHVDNDQTHSVVANTGRLTPRRAGVWMFTAYIDWASAADGRRAINIRQNGATVIAQSGLRAHATATAFRHECSAILIMNGTTDFVEFLAFQDSGATLAAVTPLTAFQGFLVSTDTSII